MIQIDYSLVQSAVIAFFTGFGMTFGAEAAKLMMKKAQQKINHQ